MDLKGEYLIPASKDKVWKELNNPEALKKAIKGCESLDQVSDTEYSARVKAKIGPVSAVFNGSVTLTEMDPPHSYVISGQGKGGAAGFAKGNVKITLSENSDKNKTNLIYSGNAQVGGKLAQVGSRLIGGVIKNTADDFFKTFNNNITDMDLTDSISETDITTNNDIKSKKPSISYWVWIGSLIIFIGIILAFFT
ncbi:MAG: carbon monoxide dehydrogenase subunit G [Alphaproteobacteria bacterium]|nr:carbon monoxide dehydrogenase subunit G [Alphaproteobacteria bacterium]